VPQSAIDVLEKSIRWSETWVVVFGVIVAVGIVGEVAFGLHTFFLNKRFRNEQKAEEQRSREEIARLTSETEKARHAAADAQAQAARANETAEHERLERVKIEQRLAPRHVSAAQQKQISDSLKRYAGQKLNVFVYNSSPEAVSIANEVIAALDKHGAGWALSVSTGQEGSGRAVPGMLVELKPVATKADSAAAHALVEALSHEGLAVAGPRPIWMGASGAIGSINEDPTANIKLTIGQKP